jgi:hypothetical protein
VAKAEMLSMNVLLLARLALAALAHVFVYCRVEGKGAQSTPMSHWLRITDNLHKAGFNLG